MPPYYDSLIAKLIVHDVDRDACLRRLERSLSECVIDGISTSVPLLRDVLAHEDPASPPPEDIRQVRFDTRWLGHFLSNRNS